MHVLITGGAGFIGSHLGEALVGRGDSVAVIDDLSTGTTDNIAHLAGGPRFSLTIESIRDDRAVDHLVRQADAVVHLAAAVGVQLVVERPTETIETNVLGAHAVLAAARRHRCRTLIASTSEVYGKSAELPFKEESDLLLGPSSHSRWGYAASKLLDEFLGLAAHRQYGLPVVIARLFNTVGPRQTGRYGMVIPRFVQQALRGEPLTVFGDGEQSRCFCHVKDVVRALIALLDRPGPTSGEIYNIGSCHEININRLAEQVIARAGSRSSVAHISYSEAYGPGFEDMRRRVPDIGKIQRATGWSPALTLPEVLDDVIAHERDRI